LAESMDLPSVFTRYKDKIDQELRSILADLNSPMYDMLRYQLGWIDADGDPVSGPSGKALRPTLCLLSSEAISGEFENSLPAAAAIEFVHNFSLIHDDVQDDDRERRGRPSVWAIWGKPQAINAGTAMRVLASLNMLRLLEKGIPAEKLLQAQKILDETCMHLIQGQYFDISFESRVDVSVSEYLWMAKEKTAALIACAFELGAMLVTDDQETIKAFRNCGLNIGLAFQIRDDYLGIWGDQDKLGKPVGGDIRRKKKSFPIAYAWEQADSRSKTVLTDIYQLETIDDIGCENVMSVLGVLCVKEQTQVLVNTYSDRARAELDKVNSHLLNIDYFEEIFNFLTKREY